MQKADVSQDTALDMLADWVPASEVIWSGGHMSS